MKAISALLLATIATGLCAQSPLVVNPTGAGLTFGATDGQNFFDLTVSTTVTLQALEFGVQNSSGTTSTIEFWMTNTGITTHVGSEANAANWHMVTSGDFTSGGFAVPVITCQGPQAVLQPGTYGCCVHYNSVALQFVGVTSFQTFTNTELTVFNGETGGSPAWSGGFGPFTYGGTNYVGSQPQLNIHYANGVAPHACARVVEYGAGCYDRLASPYDFLTGAAAASAALTGRAVEFTFLGASGYVLQPSTMTYVAPSAAAIAAPLSLTDDSETVVSLTNPFVHPTGVATQLYVQSNGYVSLGSNNTLPGGASWIVESPVFRNATNTAWWSWHDYNVSETGAPAGTNVITFEEVGNLAYITWVGVESYPDTALNPSTFQFVFDTSTGNVTIVWQSIDSVGGSPFLGGDNHLVGYSPGGPSPDGGQFDITTLTAIPINLPEAVGLAVSASAKPLIGTTIQITTSNQTPLSLGVNFLSTGQINPGLDLTFLGLPGCVALVDIGASIGNAISDLGVGGLSMDVNLPLPNNPSLAGITVYDQSVWLDANANAFGALTSNALLLTIGNY